MKPTPNLEWLRIKFSYNRKTGELKSETGKIAGCLHKSSGYRIVGFEGVKYQVHTIVWFMETGEWRPNQLDHRDLDRSNNRWGNLREASPSQNMANKKCYSNNKCGFKGVHLHRPSGKYKAQIKKDGIIRHLGLFKSAMEAHASYVEAAKKLHGEYTNVTSARGDFEKCATTV